MHGNQVLKGSNKILKTTILFSVFVLLAQVIGLVRDLYLARVFGVSAILDIYYLSFKIPDMLNIFYSVFLGSVVFVPLLTKARHDGGISEIIKKVKNVGTLVLTLLLFFSTIIFIFMPTLAALLAPNFSPEQQTILVHLSRILIVGQFFFPIGILAGSIGLIYDKPKYMAMSAFVYNFIILFGSIILHKYFGIYGVAYSVVAAACLFALVQIIPSEVREVYKNFRPEFDFKSWFIFFKSNFARFFAVASYQMYGVLVLYLAGLTGVGNISIFSISYNVFLAMFYVLGSSLGTVLMPKISELHVEGNKEMQKENLNNSLIFLGYISFIFATFAIMFSLDIIKTLYFFSKLSEIKMAEIADILSYLLLSFVFFNMSEIVRKYFYSTNQIFAASFSTILLIAIVAATNFLLLQAQGGATLLKVCLSLFFGTCLSFLFILFYLEKKGEINFVQIAASLYKIFIICILIGASSYFIKFFVYSFIITAILKGLLLLALTALFIFFFKDKIGMQIFGQIRKMI